MNEKQKVKLEKYLRSTLSYKECNLSYLFECLT